MKGLRTITFMLIGTVCISIASCKKEKETDTPIAVKKEVPEKILLQNSITAATLGTVDLTYNVNMNISRLLLTVRGSSLDYKMNYNPNESLNTVSEATATGTRLYNFDYSSSGILNRFVQNDNGVLDTTEINYLASSNTYVLQSTQTRIILDANDDVTKIENWFFGIDIDLTYVNNKDGVFANVNLDPSVVIFINNTNLYSLYYLFLHQKQITSLTSTNNTNSTLYNFQDYIKDDKGNITSFQYSEPTDTPTNCSINYIAP